MKSTELVRLGSVGELRRGDQIAYVPMHCQKPVPELAEQKPGYFQADVDERGVELGFVTSVSPDGIFVWCRFWYPDPPYGRLRTKLNSERCDVNDVVRFQYVDDQVVADALERWCV